MALLFYLPAWRLKAKSQNLKSNLLTERQTKILYSAVQEYIKTAKPIASVSLVKKCKLGFSHATIRNEFAELEDRGFLEQPHTSGGRVPTSKAYRYFVDGLLLSIKKERQKLDNLEKMVKLFVNSEHFNRRLVKSLANASNNMAMGWINNDADDEFHFAGIKNLLRAPEFESIEYSAKVGDILDRIDDEIEDFVREEKDFSENAKIYIGNEMPIRGAKDFSLIISSIPSRWGDLRIAIFGPQRMDYERNLQLLNSVKRLLE